jgi:hypothetical protein
MEYEAPGFRPEDSKMQRELVWGEGTTVVEGLAKAFSEMLEEARVQAKDAVEAPARAVHQYRRALRRAESVLILAAPLMRRPQRRWLEEAVGRGRRRTRVLRDLDAVVPLVPTLSEALPSVDSSIFEALGKWLEQCRTELASEEIAAWRLRKNMRALAGLGDIFAVGLFGWADLDMLLDKEMLREPPAAALVFACNLRGSRLFGLGEHDAALISRRFGGIPAAGFHCAGEIAPIGPRSYLNSQTTAIALFRAGRHRTAVV